jgi:hypothetical protein
MCYSGKKIFDEKAYKTWFEAEFPDCKGEHLPECLTEFKAESNLAKAISKASATGPDANLRLSPPEAVGIIKFIQTNMIQPEEQRKAVHSARLAKSLITK